MWPLQLLKCIAVFLVLGGTAAPAAQTVRVLVSIGNDVGAPGEQPLRFAALDAQRVRDTFVELGDVDPARAHVLLNQPLATVRKQLGEVKRDIARLADRGMRVTLLLFVSSHGKDGILHINGAYLPASELRSIAGSTRARVRVLILDTCDSAQLARKKGVRPAKAFEVAVQTVPLQGEVVLTSSGPTEAAQEWDSLGGSLFTHHLLAGLRGDADADQSGAVSLAEAFTYAQRRTVVQAQGSGQHPAFDFDLVGSDELVLSRPARSTSAVVFPAALEGRYVLSSQPRPDVVTMVEKTAGRALRIAVPPGRYVLRKHAGARVGVATIEMPYGGEHLVRETDLQQKHFADVVLKGGLVDSRPSRLVLIGTVEQPPIVGTGARYRGGLAHVLHLGTLWLETSFSAGRHRYRGVDLTITESSLSASVALGHRWLEFPVVPGLGIGAEVLAQRQVPVRDRADITHVFGPLPVRETLGFAAGPVASVEIPLVASLIGLVEVRALARHLRAQRQPFWTVGLKASAGLGVRF